MNKISGMKTLLRAAWATVGLRNGRPAGWLMAGAVVGAGMLAMPAWSQQAQIRGVGVVIQQGRSFIVARTDAKGVIRFSGLEPGEYEVGLIGEWRPIMVSVVHDGMLTIRAMAENSGSNRRVEAIGPDNSTARVMAGRGQIEEVGRLRGGFIVPVADYVRIPNSVVDVNRSSAPDIVRLAPTISAEAAAFIVGERAKGGEYMNPIDFAQRVCPTVSVDFDLAPTRMGNALIIARGGTPGGKGFGCGDPKTPGFLTLFSQSYSYVAIACCEGGTKDLLPPMGNIPSR